MEASNDEVSTVIVESVILISINILKFWKYNTERVEATKNYFLITFFDGSCVFLTKRNGLNLVRDLRVR